MLLNKSLHSLVINHHFRQELENKPIYNFPLSMNNPEDWDSLLQNFTWDKNKYHGIILDAFHEAPEEWRITKFALKLISLGVPPEKILWIDSGFNLPSEIKHISFPVFLNSYKDETTSVVPYNNRTKMFLALARNPKTQRVKFIIELLKLNLDQMSVITCGCGKESFDNKDVYYFVPEEYKSSFPILLNSKTVDIRELNIIEEEFKNCMFNVVLETSFENIFPNTGWDRHFYTEKTGKAFFLEQIPLFLAKKGYVAKLRNLGFELFDDIVDHHYDSIDDPVERIHALSLECLRLSKQNLDYYKNIQGLEKKFIHNKQLRLTLAEKLDKIALTELQNWIQSM